MSFPRKTLERLLILMTAFFTSPATFADWNSAPEKVVRDHPTWIFTPNSTLPNGKHGLMVVLSAGSVCLNRFSGLLSGMPAGFRPPRCAAAG
jgi:hypothetical protein